MSKVRKLVKATVRDGHLMGTVTIHVQVTVKESASEDQPMLIRNRFQDLYDALFLLPSRLDTRNRYWVVLRKMLREEMPNRTHAEVLFDYNFVDLVSLSELREFGQILFAMASEQADDIDHKEVSIENFDYDPGEFVASSTCGVEGQDRGLRPLIFTTHMSSMVDVVASEANGGVIIEPEFFCTTPSDDGREIVPGVGNDHQVTQLEREPLGI
jgi:hypothetical protein